MPVPRSRPAVVAVFFANGIGWASWASRLPAISDRLQLREGSLGLALLGATIGLSIAAAMTSLLVHRFGSQGVVVVAGLAMSGVLPVIGWAPGFAVFAAALIAYGMTNGALDIASNAQAVAVERQVGRSMMSGFHAMFSAGAIAGAVSAGIAAALEVPVELHLTAVSICLAVVLIAAAPALTGPETGTETLGPRLAFPRGPLLALAALAFCVLLAEGAVFDWGAMFLRNVAGATPAMAALGLAVFQAAMMLGRLVGDRAATAFGPHMVVATGTAIGFIGLGLALLLATTPTTLIGYGLLGLGLSTTFPLTLSAAARSTEVPTPTALAATTAGGYAGFIVGPPLIGFAAEATSLPVGLGIVLGCLIIAAGLSPRVKPPIEARGAGPEPTVLGHLKLSTMTEQDPTGPEPRDPP